MSKSSRSTGLQSSMAGLKISTDTPSSNQSQRKPSKKPAVADSWDDGDDDDSAAEEDDEVTQMPSTSSKSTHKRTGSHNPHAPPPTPATLSPSLPTTDWSSSSSKFAGIDSTAFDSPMQDSIPSSFGRGGGNGSRLGDTKRPEKSTAVASRLIAAGIGAKPARRTEEQKQYDKAIRQQEMKKKEREIVEKKKIAEERERAKRSVWED